MFGLLTFGAATAIVLPILSTREIETGLDGGDVASIIAGGATATALFAALGVGVGTVVRDQAGAIVAALILLYAVEPLLTFIPGIGHAVQRYGLGGRWALTTRASLWLVHALLPLAALLALHVWVAEVKTRPAVRRRLGGETRATAAGMAAVHWLYLVALWAEGGGGYFWPAWPLLGLLLIGTPVRVARPKDA